jgi:hypothetical protein
MPIVQRVSILIVEIVVCWIQTEDLRITRRLGCKTQFFVVTLRGFGIPASSPWRQIDIWLMSEMASTIIALAGLRAGAHWLPTFTYRYGLIIEWLNTIRVS